MKKPERYIPPVIAFGLLLALLGVTLYHAHKPHEIHVAYICETNNASNLYRININAATADELDILPGIGPVLAERIIFYRENYGPFKTTDDLLKVKGISPELLQQVKDYITAR